MFINSKTSKRGDRARLLSPFLPSSPLCMTFVYHMFGETMGTIAIYVITSTTEKFTWIKTGNRGNAWFKANVMLNETNEYKVRDLTDL